ncbi:hypothetical protein [Planomonospora venezuelensis]|uniref:Uncharacterized protein n=1 Tax=Planomonospora venezuelensis TaxID=1999 RepID=A0A841D217_PLAVE|nr:hypothetical protein [Planomonospora venezuelensis]MBB5962544.1 hypothetical protein [Planomonospora venezuelensis]GIM99050.1 hypothetical protein Pve01_07090 [Planomonospora venezuelensis]
MVRSWVARDEHGGAFREDASTRHLCAGTYRDRDFRRVILRHVHNDTSRLVAPSYGFDLVPVVRHAWRAWFLETAQHLCVLAVLAIGFATNPPAALTGVSGLGFWYLFRLAARSTRVVLPLHAKAAMDRWLRRTRWRSESDELRQHTRLLRLSGFGCAVLSLMPFMVAGFSRVPLSEMTQSTVLLVSLLVIVVGGRHAVQQWCLNHMHRAASLRPRKLTLRQQTIDDQQSHPYVVYRRPSPLEPETQPGDFTFELLDEDQSPFVGSGELVHRWLPPLTIQLFRSLNARDNPTGHTPMEELEHATPRFQAHELIAHLHKAMTPMGDPDDPNGLRGFRINDRLYIAEADVPPHPEWLRKRPSQSEIDKTIDDPYNTSHHFLEISTSATGELVTTVFLRVTVKGRALSLDFAACALTRTPVEYQWLNGFAESGASAVIRSTVRGLFSLPTEVSDVWRLTEAPLLLIGAVRARKNRMLKPRRGMAIGAQVSIREEKSTPWKHAQLDEVTIHDHMKLIEQRLLKATEDFLESREIDTSTFKKRATSIINTGVLNMGGKTEIKQSAVGTNAQVRADTRESDTSSGQAPTNEGDQQ